MEPIFPEEWEEVVILSDFSVIGKFRADLDVFQKGGDTVQFTFENTCLGAETKRRPWDSQSENN